VVTVEFFLVVPLVILALVSAIQVIGLARARLDLQSAVRDGARAAATTPDPAKAVAVVLDALPETARTETRVSVQRPSRVGVPAKVSATTRYVFGFPFPGRLSVNVSASATMLTER
jgi:Flp pilus assembly protein TadG